MSQLGAKYAIEVQDIFTNPPDKDKYETLKNQLIHRLTASQGNRIRQLLEQEEIGDRSPSQFLRHMRRLAGTAVSDEFLRTLWAGRLPNMTRVIVTTQTDLPLDKLAEIADQIPAEGAGQPQISSIATDRGTEMLLQRLEQLEARIAELSVSRPRQRSGSRFRRRSRSRSKSREQQPSSQGKVCWYHQVFKERSTKCRPPCSHESSENGPNRR
ncbi:uncharacterized protein LOC143360301 [Halictus rubicundus]|uniref:uncharacterized protein LOC143360301 n=1 Tax=Halictus rubicundus TaxID=77578 RepID=UPI004035382E